MRWAALLGPPAGFARQRPVATAAAGLADRRLPSASDWLFAAALVAAVVLAYQPVWHAGFIWDDNAHLTENPCVVGPLGLKEIWTTTAARIRPLVQTTFWLEYKIWGLAPLPYHLVNVFLHAVNALLLWQVLRKLGVFGAAWRGHLGAAPRASGDGRLDHRVEEHAVHLFLPVDDPVLCKLRPGPTASGPTIGRAAGIGELCVRRAGGREQEFHCGPPRRAGTVALLARRPLGLAAVLNLLPFVLLAIASAALAVWTQSLDIGGHADWERGWPERFAVAGMAIWFYLGKLFWPHPLIFVYPRWKIDISNLASYVPLLAVIVSFAGLWRRAARLGKGGLVRFHLLHPGPAARIGFR